MAEKDLERICQLALNAHGLKLPPSVSHPTFFWDASFFKVQNCKLYSSLTEMQRRNFLESMSTHILHEACSIEKAGMTYSARMTLQSKTIDERIIYSLIGAEEALHLKSLEPFLNPQHQSSKIPYFAGLIQHWIEKLEGPSLLIMIQILLEGWGLTYYQSLADESMDPLLQSILKQILRDESRHHATGVVLYRHELLSTPERENLEQELITLFQCVQVGPQQAAVELALCSENKTVDFHQLLFEMNAQTESETKLSKLKKLLEKTCDERLVSFGLRKELFKPAPLEQMALVAEEQFLSNLKNCELVKDRKSDISL